MAQVRQQAEEYQSGLIACFNEHGLEPIRHMAGGVGFVNFPQDAASLALLDEVSAVCNSRVPLPEFAQSETLDDAAYQRMLDLRQCIVAHGYEIPAPPSAEVWKESSPWYDAWNPYEVLTGPGAIKISETDLYALAEVCPQPGPNFISVAPTGS